MRASNARVTLGGEEISLLSLSHGEGRIEMVTYQDANRSTKTTTVDAFLSLGFEIIFPARVV